MTAMPPEPVSHPSEDWVERYSAWFENRMEEYRIVTPTDLLHVLDDVVSNAKSHGLVDSCIDGCLKAAIKRET